MSDNKSGSVSLELITKTMNGLAREIGAMDPEDPKRADFVKELCDLTQLNASWKVKTNELMGQRMDELAREVASLQRGDPRRALIVSEIFRLADLRTKPY
jgi:hypothetical protein